MRNFDPQLVCHKHKCDSHYEPFLFDATDKYDALTFLVRGVLTTPTLNTLSPRKHDTYDASNQYVPYQIKAHPQRHARHCLILTGFLIDVKPGGTAAGLYIDTAVPKPDPNSEQCLVRVKAFGLNRGDTLQREGRYPPPLGVTSTMGLEFAGIVESVGGDDQDEVWKKGDEVFGLVPGGAYAEFVVVAKGMLIRKPSQVSWAFCGGLCEVGHSDSPPRHMRS